MATIDNLSIQVTANADSAASALNRLASSAGGLRGAAAKAGGGMRDLAAGAKDAGTATQQAGQQAGNAEKHTRNYGRAAEEAGKAAKRGTAGISSFWQAITGAVGVISKVTGVSGFAQDALGMLGKSFGSIGQAISKYGIMGLPKFFGDELVSSIKKPIAAIGNFVAGIKRIAYYRIIRTIIKEITQAINEGMKSLYAWSKTADGTFKNTMDGLAASTQYLGNSFAAMISPLINALSPAIDFIVDKFVDMFNTISQIIARLTGQTSYTAAKKVAAQWGGAAKSAGKSAKDAADEIKRTILGFDEINKLNGNTDSNSGGGSGGSGGGSASGMFETLPIEEEIVSFADMLKNAFIHGEWHTLGTLLGDKINEMVDSIDWAGTGETVGWYINGWFSTKYWTLDTINFTNIGSKIAEFLNSMIGQIDFNILGRLMVQKFTIVYDMVIGFIETFDWGQYGEKLSNFATGIFQELSKWFQKTDWVKLGESIVNGIVAFFGSYDYTGLAKSVSEFLGSALGAAVGLITGLGKAIGEKIGEAFNGIGQFFNEQIEACGGDIVGGILRGIIVGLTNIGVWIVENIFQPFINGFKAAFGIASPAKTMEEPGKNIVLGIFQGIINALKNVGQWVKENIFDPIWGAIKDAGAIAINITVSLVKKVGEWAEDAWEVVKSGAETIIKTVQAIFTEVGTWAGNVWDAVKAGAETIVKEVKAIFTEVGKWAGNVWDAVKAGAETIVKEVKAIFTEVGEWAGNVWTAIKNGAETIVKTVKAIFTEVGTWAGNVWDTVKAGTETIVKTVEAGMKKAASWIDSIVDFILGPESSDKKANIVMAIENTALAIVNFLRDPATAIKNIILSLGVKFAQGVEKFWNWITGQDGQSEVTVDAYGNFMIVPKAGEGLTDNGNGQFALTNDVAGTTVLTPEKSDNWQDEWDKLVGGEIPVSAKLSPNPASGSSTLGGIFGTVFDVLSNLTGKTDGSLGLKGVYGSYFETLSKLTGATEKSLTTTDVYGASFDTTSKLTGKEKGTQGTVGVYGSFFETLVKLTGMTERSLGLVPDGERKGVFASAFSVLVGLTGKTGDSKDLTPSSKRKGVFASFFTVLSKLTGKDKSSKTLNGVFGDTFTVKATLSSTINGLSEFVSTVAGKLKDALENIWKKITSSGAATGGVITNGRLTRFESGGIINNSFVRKLPHYAGGTMDAHGTLFVAGEAGPEILGHIGGRTEILNQSQLAATMFAAVRSAMGGVKIAATMYDGGADSDEADYEMMYRAMYDAFTDAMAPNAERDREKVALMRQIAAKEFTAEVTANSVNRAQTRMNRRAGTTIVPVGS